MQLKNLFLASLVLLLLNNCKQENSTPVNKSDQLVTLVGKTMGTTYQIKYLEEKRKDYQREIDSILVAINEEVSTYIPSSTISLFNSQEGPLDVSSKHHFRYNLDLSKKLNAKTDGFFDPTIGPLVNYWGFGYKGKKALESIDSAKIEQILSIIGMELIDIAESNGVYVIQKLKSGVELDFSAVAKGYAVDQVSEFLEEKGIENYLTEIGGENRARGNNQNNTIWTVGINTPKPGSSIDDMIMAMRLENNSLATSGDYRQFYVMDGKMYSHEIDPKTGYPKVSPLISVSVVASDCATSDALATAFIVMGLDRSLELIEKLANTEACFIVADEEMGFKKVFSSGFSQYTFE
jgi:thiamine biosynthesis lipoprotein